MERFLIGLLSGEWISVVSLLSFAIVAALFLFFLYFVTQYIVARATAMSFLVEESIKRGRVLLIWDVIFKHEGMPKNWETQFEAPLVLIGLKGDLFRIAIRVNETKGEERNLTLNVTIEFDSECELKAWNTTVRVYEQGNSELISKLYNQSFCEQQYLRRADLVFNATFSANEVKIFYVYFSPERIIEPPTYDLAFGIDENVSMEIYDVERLWTLSTLKVREAGNESRISYENVTRMFGIEKKYLMIEVEPMEGVLLANLTIAPPIAPRGTVIVRELPLVMQDLDGRIKYVRAKVSVW
jgi:hypothetical protein